MSSLPRPVDSCQGFRQHGDDSCFRVKCYETEAIFRFIAMNWFSLDKIYGYLYHCNEPSNLRPYEEYGTQGQHINHVDG